MRKNLVRDKLKRGEATIGCYLGLGSANVAELLAIAGFDWLMIETEHNSTGLSQVEHMLMAIGTTTSVPIVRVASADPIRIQQGLDIGAQGVLVPMVRTASEVENIVNVTRYPPQGVRGFGPLRASRYTFDYEDYLMSANENILVAIIVETAEAVRNLESIVAVPGLDVIVLGLCDLSLSYGKNPIKMPHRETEDAIQRALELGRKNDVAVGIGVSTPQELTQRRQQGFSFLNYSSDYRLLRDAAYPGLEAFRQR